MYQSLVPHNQDSFDMMKLIPDQDEVFIQVKNLSKTQYRKVCQNSLYWAFINDCEKTDINEHAGNSADEWHYRFKKDYLVRIYERDNVEYGIMMQSLRSIYKRGLKSECEVMRDHVIRETSTTKATIKQFCEYLNSIERWCHSQGIYLRTDSDIYKTALKVR